MLLNCVGVTYDSLGRVVEQNRSGAHTQKIYSPTGFQMQIVNGQTSVYSFSPMPGGGATIWSAPAGAEYYRHADWLGSSRFASTYTRTVFYDGAYAPFGEQYANSGTSDLSFTGMDSDTSSNLSIVPGILGAWYFIFGLIGIIRARSRKDTDAATTEDSQNGSSDPKGPSN
jgi:hypothetical protein